ncbi:uncharacterized protein TM35_000291000 [Trypanosoma theileri]|uniref:Uncharacterized protein n=1 Tax=Trypanosoma theileri TaxID=67003 RepID=A0A1X0NNY5_9TRYP|nr:uncharacterized protein TM35_000291000 [Trypanosoma theileri]ORC86218.1 hypothetical protein TM35_000291000 [Trypanosoma theileri]
MFFLSWDSSTQNPRISCIQQCQTCLQLLPLSPQSISITVYLCPSLHPFRNISRETAAHTTRRSIKITVQNSASGELHKTLHYFITDMLVLFCQQKQRVNQIRWTH